MKLSSGTIVLLLSTALSFSAHGINKCVDEKGRVSYQDKPCKTSQLSKVIELEQKGKGNRDSDSAENLVPLYVKIPGVGEGVLFAYKWWNTTIIQPNPDFPPTVKMTSKAGEEPISFSITFIPNKSGAKISMKETSNTIKQMASQYVAGSVEKEAKLRRLETTIGPAIYASFNEKKYQNSAVPKGEFSSITVGQAAHSKIVVAFTVLTNGTDSKALEEAFNIIGSFKIVVNK